MKYFNMYVPTKVCYGCNIIKSSLDDNKNLFNGNILIVSTGRSLIRLGYLDELKNYIRELPLVKDVVSFDNVSANPKLSEVQSGIDLGNQFGADVVVGFGGGSALDAAKAIAAGIGMSVNIETLFSGNIVPDNRTLPIIAIPTTSGTGSELSKSAILSDDILKKKSGVRGDVLYPALAIVDSKYTETVPLNITMETGFDVFAHAFESYVSNAATPFTEMLSEKAIEIVGNSLISLQSDLQNSELRKNMSFASMIMGINLGNASTALPHRMQYPVGAHTNTSHAAGLAALYTAWVEIEYKYSEEKVKKALELLMGKKCTSSSEAKNLINEFINTLGLCDSLSALGVTDIDIDTYKNEVTGNINNDPAAAENNVIKCIYGNSL